MKQIYQLGASLFCLCAVISSCNRELLPEEVDPVTLHTTTTQLFIPYADTLALKEFDTQPDAVDFALARKLAIIDLTVNKSWDRYGWSDGRLSSAPVAVYGFDGRPLFYDFIVLDANETPVGTVTVHARKRSATPICRVSKQIGNYGVASKSGGDQMLFADIQGTRYAAPVSKSHGSVGSATNLQTQELVDGLRWMSDEEILAYMRDVALPAMLGSSEAVQKEAEAMEARMLEQHQAAERYWILVDQNEQAIRAYSSGDDPFLPEGPVIPEEPWWPQEPTPPFLHFDNDGAEMFWIREYAAKFKNYTWIGEFCGPWITGYVLSTLYENNINPSSFDKEGYTVQGGAFRGAMTAPCLNFALSDYSQGKITLGLNGLSFYDAYWHVREKQAVARLLINWPIQNGYHWTVLYGCYRVDRALTTNYYFMQADNGVLISTSYRNQRNEGVFESYNEIQWFDTLFPIWGQK